MSLLAKVQSGASVGPQVYVVYGPPKERKSTFAASFPSPIFFDIENGTGHLNVSRFTSTEVPTYKALVDGLKELLTVKHNFKTVVVDSITALESYMAKHICGAKYKDISEMPFGQGYSELTELTVTFMNVLIELKKAGLDVVLVGHSKTKTFTDALDNSSYDRYVLQVNEKMAEKIKSYADNIFFLKREVLTVKGDNGKSQAIDDGTSYLHTAWKPGADAGNRLNLPAKIANPSYAAISDAIKVFKPNDIALKEEIQTLLSKADAQTVTAVSAALEKAGGDLVQLERIKTKLSTLVVG